LSNKQRKLYNGFFSFSGLLISHLFGFCLGKLVKNLNPKVIVANDDVLRYKPITIINPKLIVLQSASISEMSEAYVALLFSRFLDESLLSDIFCVSGIQSESMKQRFLGDAKNVVVTGQPRFDSFARADELHDESKVRKKLGLAINKKIVLLASSTHGQSLEESKKSISAIYGSVNSIKNVQLLVKLHPAENQEAPLYRQNQSHAPIILRGAESILQSLYVCDVMVTKSSTTTLEAAILNKPIIILNLSGKPDIVPYVKKGIALGVYKAKDLTPAIKNALYNREIREKLAKKREKFVHDYAYIQDGKASERVAKLIVQASNESSRNKVSKRAPNDYKPQGKLSI